MLVTYGDVPLLRTSTLAALAAEHRANGNAVTMLTASLPDPTGYGRIIRDPAGDITAIVEQKDADRRAAGDPGGQLRGLRLRRGPC